MLSVLSLHPTSATQQQLFVHTQISSVITCYLSHIIETGWDKVTKPTWMPSSRSSSTSTAIQPIPIMTPQGQKALAWRQAHAREDWHQKPADFKKKANDLSIHNNVTQAHWHNDTLHLYTPCTTFSSTVVIEIWRCSIKDLHNNILSSLSYDAVYHATAV